MTESPPKVALLTPCYDGRAHVDYFRGIKEIQQAFAKEGIATAHMTAGHCANLPRLRNILAAHALEWGAEGLLWIDSDIQASGRDALRLWKSEKAIIGAAPQKRPLSLNEPPQVAFTPLPGGDVFIDEGLIEVGGVATAFCMTRRVVFEEMRHSGIAHRLANKEAIDSDWFRNFFWYELVPADDGRYLDDGEDLYFCRKAREAGFRCFIEPSVRPVHHEGNLKLTANFLDVHGSRFKEAEKVA